MFAKSFAAGLAATTMLAGVAFAQTPTTTTDRANTTAAATESSFQGTWRTSKMDGLKVYNDQNQDIGSIDDLLMDKSGNVKAAVISVGGFLGMGSRLVAIPFEKIKFVNEPVPSTGTAQNTSGSSSTTTTGAATTSGSTASKSNPWYPDHAVFNASKDELKAMPEFKFSTNE
ncbi:MAG TPA: PRC-barrel domain-containing protein [Bradyrhizobium sp.]|nr:PRC-barrel domain-containing protein [Bradyrhizobium sp.]